MIRILEFAHFSQHKTFLQINMNIYYYIVLFHRLLLFSIYSNTCMNVYFFLLTDEAKEEVKEVRKSISQWDESDLLSAKPSLQIMWWTKIIECIVNSYYCYLETGFYGIIIRNCETNRLSLNLFARCQVQKLVKLGNPRRLKSVLVFVCLPLI